MIIELFGAPASGKTVFAQQLGARLRSEGHSVDVLLSFRPAEIDERRTGSPILSPISRLMRPVIERLTAGGSGGGASDNCFLSSALLGILPARSPMWSLRLRQYTTRLEASWRLAERSREIVIIDQGFVQLVCSLVLLGRAPDEVLAARALEMIPRAGLLIRLSTPLDALRARLEARRHGQGMFERWFELDTETNLRSIQIVEMLDDILRRQDQPVLHIACRKDGTPPEAIDKIVARMRGCVAVTERVSS